MASSAGCQQLYGPGQAGHRKCHNEEYAHVDASGQHLFDCPGCALCKLVKPDCDLNVAFNVS